MKIPFYRTHRFHKQSLKVTVFVIGSFAPVFFLGTMLSSAEPARWTLDVLKVVLAGVLSWFFLDTSGSIASGNPGNAFFNTIVLPLAVGSLWLPALNDHTPEVSAK